MIKKQVNTHITPSFGYQIRHKKSNLQFFEKKHQYPKHRYVVRTHIKQNPFVLTYHDLSKSVESPFLVEDQSNILENSHEEENSYGEISKEDTFNLNPLTFNEEKKGNVHTKVIVCLSFILVIVLGWIGFEVYKTYFKPTIQWNATQVEYGDTKFIPFQCKEQNIITSTPLDVFTVGKQKVTVSYEDSGEIIKESKNFKVVDTKFPEIAVETDSITTILGHNPNYEKLGVSCKDPVEGDVSYSIQPIDVNSIGIHKTDIVAEDINGNQTTQEIKVIVTGVGDEETLNNYQKQRIALVDEYNAKIKKQKEEEKRRLQREKEELERQKLIASLGTTNLSDTVLRWALDVHKINQEIWDTQYDALILAVIQVESNGVACDLLQASESQGGGPPGNSCGVFKDEQEALKTGIQAIKNIFDKVGVQSSTDYDRIAYALQGYNFGPRYLKEYSKYTYANSLEFSEKMKKELGWNVYGLPGYPERVFKYFNPNYVFKEEPKPNPTPEPKPEPQPEPEKPESKPEEEIKPENPEDNQGNNQDTNENEDLGGQQESSNN